jgi:hypothetical protein
MSGKFKKYFIAFGKTVLYYGTSEEKSPCRIGKSKCRNLFTGLLKE